MNWRTRILHLQVENRELHATNQALRDVEHEVNRLRHALNYRERSVFKLVAGGDRRARFLDLVANGHDQSRQEKTGSKATCRW